MEISGDNIRTVLEGRGMRNAMPLEELMGHFNLSYGNTKGVRKLEQCISEVLAPRGDIARENGMLWRRP